MKFKLKRNKKSTKAMEAYCKLVSTYLLVDHSEISKYKYL